jgi:hypothetical protein
VKNLLFPIKIEAKVVRLCCLAQLSQPDPVGEEQGDAHNHDDAAHDNRTGGLMLCGLDPVGYGSFSTDCQERLIQVHDLETIPELLNIQAFR